jgi:hypothetical protein
MLPDKNKKAVLNEGRQVIGGKFMYGGFPRVIKEEGVVKQFNDADDTNHKDEKIATHSDEDAEGAFYARMDAIRAKMEPLQRAKRHKKATSEQLSALSELEKKYKEELSSRPKREGKKERIEFHPDSQTGHGAPGSGSRYTGD